MSACDTSKPARIFALINARRVTMLCAAPTVLIAIANAPAELRRGVRRGVRVLTAGAPPAAATIARVEGELGWDIIHVYGLTETSPFITICEPRARARRAVAAAIARCSKRARASSCHLGRVARRRRRRATKCRRTAQTARRDRRARQRRDEGLLQRPRGDRAAPSQAAASTPATGRSFTPTATSRSAIASRTSSSAAARTSPRSRSKVCYFAIRRSRKSRSSACPTRNGAKPHTRSSSSKPGASADRSRAPAIRARPPGALQNAATLPHRRRAAEDGHGKIQKYVLRGGRAAITAQ